MKISTQLQVSNAPVGVHKVVGVVGLYLKVGDTGSGSWFFRYRFADRRREIGLGSRDRVTLAEARDAAKDQDALRRRDVDPVDERRRVRAEMIAKSKAKPGVTFKQAVDLYLAAYAGNWKHRHARAVWLNPVKNYAYPIIGDLALDQIGTAHVLAVMKACKAAGVVELARRIKVNIKRVLEFAVTMELRDAALRNPADLKDDTLPKRQPDRPHFRAVDLDDAPAIFQELKAGAATSTALSAWVFMIATASRPSESLGARWLEVDLSKALWTRPAARMKSGRAHIVPLSSLALEVLERQARVRSGDAVFPGRGGSPISYSGFAAAPATMKIAAASAHGWRSVFRDWAGDIGDIDGDLAEAALAHSLGKVEASYRRRTAVERRREVMELYAAWLNSDGEAQVIAFPAARKA